jgi:crotonobetainyl-CoA:carnitine CoA-transferase CaiB-like acyl-CoA transferase
MFLADMGADVVKIEDTGHGDYVRKIGAGEQGDSAYFHMLNRNKRSLALDFRADAGRAVLLRLAADADILIEGFRPGTLAGFGLGFDELAPLNRKLVYCSLTGFGQSGPCRDRAGHDMNYAAYAGLADQVGNRDGPPANSNFQFADIAGGTLAAMASILAALYDAQRTGHGRYLDVSITDSAFAMGVISMAGLNLLGRSPERGHEMISGRYPWYRFYQTADGGYVHLGALEWRFWRNFCDAIDRPHWAERQMAEGAESEAMADEIAKLFRTRSRDDWVAELAPKDTCVAPVLSPEEAAESELLRSRGMLADYAHPEDENFRQPAFPVAMTGYTFEARTAPRHGEHSRTILEEAGLDESEIDELARDGVVRIG